MSLQLVILLRVVLAGFLSGLIGAERELQDKDAGLRTHFLVGAGSALFMSVSLFAVQAAPLVAAHDYDPSRIAAQVVSGVGFLGAGVIFLDRQRVRGLTTSAGIWAVAALGLAIGSGFYVAGVGITLIFICAMIYLHKAEDYIKRLSRRRKRRMRQSQKTANHSGREEVKSS